MQIFPTINEDAVNKILNIDEETKSHLRKIDTHSFDIFNVRESTKDNEMVVIICHILAREKIFDSLPILNEKFLSFIKKI